MNFICNSYNIRGFEFSNNAGGGDLVTEQRIHLRVCTFLLSTLIRSLGPRNFMRLLLISDTVWQRFYETLSYLCLLSPASFRFIFYVRFIKRCILYLYVLLFPAFHFLISTSTFVPSHSQDSRDRYTEIEPFIIIYY